MVIHTRSSSTARADGSWEAFGPAGTWPLTATLEGYVTFEGDVTFAAGAMTPGQDIFLHRLQPHAFIDGGPFTVILRPREDNDPDHCDLELRWP